MRLNRLVAGAAIAIVGCSSDAATGGAEVPPFSGAWSPAAPGAPVAEVPDDGVPDAPPNEGAVNEPPANEQPVSEGQDPDGVSLENGGTATSPDSSETPGTDQASNGSENGPGETPAEQPETGPEEPAEPQPVGFAPLDCNAPAPALNGGTEACRVNASGNVDGQSWFMWYSGANGCMTPYEGLGGAFRATWNNSGDFLARMGQGWNETQTFDQIGTIGADLQFTRTGTAGGYSFIGIYGWSNDPLVEYYIVEDSFGNGPATPYATQQRGTISVDGATYRVYTGTKTNQPSIHGTATFTQVFSVRQSPRGCGHVSISDHFRQWQGMGINLGKMYEARVLVEAGGGSGSINFTRASVTVD